jgi:hypothetical protein
VTRLRRSLRPVRERLLPPERLAFLLDYTLILAGALIQALSMHLFFIPAQLVAGGLAGSAQLLNSLTGWPVGTMVLVGNIPLLLLGWRYLGRRRFLVRLVGTLLPEADDEWQVSRRYFSQDSMRQLYEPDFNDVAEPTPLKLAPVR